MTNISVEDQKFLLIIVKQNTLYFKLRQEKNSLLGKGQTIWKWIPLWILRFLLPKIKIQINLIKIMMLAIDFYIQGKIKKYWWKESVNIKWIWWKIKMIIIINKRKIKLTILSLTFWINLVKIWNKSLQSLKMKIQNLR